MRGLHVIAALMGLASAAAALSAVEGASALLQGDLGAARVEERPGRRAGGVFVGCGRETRVLEAWAGPGSVTGRFANDVRAARAVPEPR